jgi:SOS-response transcriptional repressor LexA
MSTAATGAGALTARQLEVLSYLYGHARDRGFQPGLAEIAVHFGNTSHSSARDYVSALERMGYVRSHGQARGIEMLKKPDGTPFTGFSDKP